MHVHVHRPFGLKHLSSVHGLVVERDIRAERRDVSNLLVGACRRYNFEAFGLRDLDDYTGKDGSVHDGVADEDSAHEPTAPAADLVK